jgi:hypothetical protein
MKRYSGSKLKAQSSKQKRAFSLELPALSFQLSAFSFREHSLPGKGRMRIIP